MQQYILHNPESFNIKHIFDCGQCFRRNQQSDGSYLGIFGNNVLRVIQKPDLVLFSGVVDGNIESIVRQYFDLDRDYADIKNNLSKIDSYMQESIEYGEGLRLLNQDLRETIISFIISANNNIPRIKGIIERLSQVYGNPILLKNQIFYSFPSPEQLKDATISDLRKLGLGFRDERVFITTRLILEGKIDLQKLYMQDTETVREQLLSLSGIGPKVADCILLFSDLKRLEVFPIDVRVRRVMNDLYIHQKNENSVNKMQIQILAHEKFGNYAGLAQEYLFYRARTKNLK